jgi:large subunit ribosomal protein L30
MENKTQETKKTTKKAVAPVEKKPTTKKNAEGMVKITLVKSTIGALKKQKDTVTALGLKKIRSSVVKPNNACTQGMIYVVRHLVSVEEVK